MMLQAEQDRAKNKCRRAHGGSRTVATHRILVNQIWSWKVPKRRQGLRQRCQPSRGSLLANDNPGVGEPCLCGLLCSGSRVLRDAVYLSGREPAMSMSTSLLALCCQSAPEPTCETPISARSRQGGDGTFTTSEATPCGTNCIGYVPSVTVRCVTVRLSVTVRCYRPLSPSVVCPTPFLHLSP